MWIRKENHNGSFSGYCWTDEPVDVSEVIAFTLADLAERQHRQLLEVIGLMYETKKEKTAASCNPDAAAG